MSREELIITGVGYLKKFGFRNVNKENILTDEVYSFHFKRFLMLGRGADSERDRITDAIIELIDLRWSKK